MFQKIQTNKKFEVCQNDYIFTKIYELYEVTKCVNILKLYTHYKHYSVRIGSISFFLI